MNYSIAGADIEKQPALKLPAAKRARVKLGLYGSRQINLLDDIDDLVIFDAHI